MNKSLFLNKAILIITMLIGNTAYATDTDCDSQVPAFVENIQNQIIIVGELHGSREMPAFAEKLICFYAKKKVPVLLGFELPMNSQSHLNSYHFSGGTDKDKEKLFSADFWKWGGKTGQASSAVYDLIEFNRKMASSGSKTISFLYQNSEMPVALGNNKEDINIHNDVSMAANIYSRALLYKDYKVIILSGNRHAKKGDDTNTMASFLEKYTPTFSITFSDKGGKVWNCQGTPMDCGEHEVKPSTDNKFTGYDALVELAELHPAAPIKK